jgi:hypothetical protein
MLKLISDGLKKYYETHDGWNKGGILTEEWKNKISESHIGLPGTNTGKTFSDEWRLKISKSQCGKEKKATHRFTDDQEKEICRLYSEEKSSTYSLGIKFDCGRNLIISILNRNNIIMRKTNYTNHKNSKNKFSPEIEKEMCELYLSDSFTRIQLANKYNCGKTTIMDILIRNSIKL